MESTIDKELAELEQKINAENAKAREPEVKAPEPEPTPAPVVPEPEPVKPEPSQPSVNPDEKQFDAKQWVEKKGWKSPEDAAKSMRAMEQEMHRKNQELSQLKAQQGYMPQAPQYAPQPPAYYPPPQAYAPPVNPYAPPVYNTPRSTEEEIAASYQMSVEDFRKVIAIQRDFYDANNRRTQAELNAWREQVTAENAKTSDMAAVVGDPAFHNPDVQKEMHEFLSQNPTVMKDPRYLSIALKESLATMGRKNAMRGSNGSPAHVPTEPPKAVGSSASSFSGRKNGVGFTALEAQKMTPEQLEKQLKGIGAFRTYEDMAG